MHASFPASIPPSSDFNPRTRKPCAPPRRGSFREKANRWPAGGGEAIQGQTYVRAGKAVGGKARSIAGSIPARHFSRHRRWRLRASMAGRRCNSQASSRDGAEFRDRPKCVPSSANDATIGRHLLSDDREEAPAVPRILRGRNNLGLPQSNLVDIRRRLPAEIRTRFSLTGSAISAAIFYNQAQMSAQGIPQIAIVNGSCTAPAAPTCRRCPDESINRRNQGTNSFLRAAAGERACRPGRW